MVGASVDAIDDGIGRALQFIVEAPIDQPADNRRIETFGRQHIAGRSALNAAFRQRPVHPLDDVTAFTEFAQRRLGLAVDHPLAGADLDGEAERFQLVQPSDLERMIFVGPGLSVGRHVDDARGVRIAGKLAVELRPALGLDLSLKSAVNVEIRPRPQFLRDEVGGAGAYSCLDVVARDHEVLPVIGTAAQDDVDVRVVGIPVIDGGPIELRAEILLHLVHQIAGEGFEVRHVHGVLRRDDEAEMVAIVAATLGEGAALDLIRLRPEQPGLLSVTGHALAAQIIEMGRERSRAGMMAHQASLDDDDARAAGEETVGANTRRSAPPEGRAIAGADPARTRDASAGLLRGSQSLRDEGPGTLRAG